MQAGTGSATVADSATAGRTAAAAAVAALDGAPADLVIVYASVRYELAELLAGVRSVTGDTPLVGATSCGHFRNGDLTDPGQGVVVLALGAGPYTFGVASVGGLAADALAAGQTLARTAHAAAGPPSGHAALLLFTDSMAGSHQRLLNGIHHVAGAGVPVVGGSAGDDRRLRETYVFHDDQVLGDAAVGVWIESPRPLTVAVAHGWRPIGLPLLVTRSEDVIVHEIAGRPALEVFQEHFREIEPDTQLWYSRSLGRHSAHAFGLIEPDGSQVIRGVYVDDEGRVRTFAPLPPYAAVQVVYCAEDDLLAVCDTVVKDALGGGDATVLLVFSCVARQDILGSRREEEAVRLQECAGAVQTFGFHTYGEFARTTSVAGYHNATLTAIAL